MARLDALIRLRRFELDQMQKHLAELRAAANRLRVEQASLAAQGEIEGAGLAASWQAGQPVTTLAAATSWGPFLSHLKQRLEDMAVAIHIADGRVEACQEEVLAKFADLKTLELTRDRAQASARLAEAQRQAAKMDEIALTRFARRSGEDERDAER